MRCCSSFSCTTKISSGDNDGDNDDDDFYPAPISYHNNILMLSLYMRHGAVSITDTSVAMFDVTAVFTDAWHKMCQIRCLGSRISDPVEPNQAFSHGKGSRL